MNSPYNISHSAASSAKLEQEKTALPQHLIHLPGGSWHLWRWIGLRGAGFSATEVLKLSAPECATAADQLIQAEDEIKRRREKALEQLQSMLDDLRRENRWSDVHARKPLLDATRLLRRQQIPSGIKFPDATKTVIDELEKSSAYHAKAEENFHETFVRTQRTLDEAVSDIAATERFQEAIIWQNRAAFHTAIEPLLRHSALTGSKQRQHRQLIANYLQRYSVKNDTIGFFGPVGWARFVESAPAISVRPGPDLLATRTVYFESWRIDELAEFFNKDLALRPWIAPRPIPYIYLNGTTLTVPMARPTVLSPQHAMALQLCDGVRIAKAIVATLMQRFPSQIRNEAEGYQVINELSLKGLVLWKFLLPPELYPERTLRKALERIDEDALRKPALKIMDELEEARATLARSAGSPQTLDSAMGELDAWFARFGGAAATRAAGKTYAARTSIYEDCRRDIELELGNEFIKELAPVLNLLLISARWLTFELGVTLREFLHQQYTELRLASGSPIVDGATFWYRIQSLLIGGEQTLARRAVSTFQQRWAKSLSIPSDCQGPLNFSSQELRPLIEAAFEVPKSFRTFTPFQSPDVMIAASDPDAIRRGDYQLVLGEFHLASNMLRASLFVAQHPKPDELFRAVESDLPEVAIRLTPPKSWPYLTARTTLTLLPPKNFRLLVTHDSFCDPEARALTIGSLVIEEKDGELLMRTRDGQLSFDISDVFADILSSQSVNRFKLMPTAGHTPRVSIDRFVISRESWTFSAEEISFADEKDDGRRFVEARRWARKHGMPQFVFAKCEVEMKPLYVDFASPLYVDILAKVARRAKGDKTKSLITISEMLPTHDQAWLQDAQGNRYTSEFRIVAVDT